MMNRMTIDPAICLGHPTIRGMRITVSVILKQIASGMSIPDILTTYPELEQEDILQALRYAAWLASERMRIVLPQGVAAHGVNSRSTLGIE